MFITTVLMTVVTVVVATATTTTIATLLQIWKIILVQFVLISTVCASVCLFPDYHVRLIFSNFQRPIILIMPCENFVLVAFESADMPTRWNFSYCNYCLECSV